VIAHARKGEAWTDLNIAKVILSDFLEPADLADLATKDGMEDLLI
jgi:hypothetical protein